MLNPDLGYYFRALRTRWWHMILGGLIGLLLASLLSLSRPNTQFRIEQRVATDDSTAISGQGGLTYLHLPARQVSAESAIVMEIAEKLDQADRIIAIPDDKASSFLITATGGSEAASQRTMDLVLGAYREARTDDYESRIATARASLDAAVDATDLTAADLDAQIAALAATQTIAAQALVSQRADAAEAQRRLAGEVTMIEWVESVQTGGVSLVDEPTFSRANKLGSSTGILIALTVVGVVIGALVALIRRNLRGNFETPADLALMNEVVVLGDLSAIGAAIFDKLAGDSGQDCGAREIRITESFVGHKALELRTVLAEHGLSATVDSVVSLERAGDRSDQVLVLLAVDRAADTERTVSDAVRMLRRDDSNPLLAVLC